MRGTKRRRPRTGISAVGVASLLAMGGIAAACSGPLRSEIDYECGVRCEPNSPTPPVRLDGELQQESEQQMCADVEIQFTQQTPTVVLLVDQSGSMSSTFDGVQRLTAVYEALMSPEDGVIASLEDDVRFGLTLYTSYNGGPTCPELTEVPPKLGNWAAMDEVFAPAEPQDDTPTAAAILLTSQRLLAEEVPGTKMILLATDGEPDTCREPDPQRGHEETLVATRAAFNVGVGVTVLAVGNELSEGHQQEVANAGAGVEDAPYYRPATRMDLVEDMNTIINGARTCVFTLDGEVAPEYAHEGTVWLNGSELAFEGINGWRLNSSNEIELLGGACEQVMSGGDDTVEGTFPCHAVLPPPR